MSGIILAKCYSIPLCGADDGGEVVFYLQSFFIRKAFFFPGMVYGIFPPEIFFCVACVALPTNNFFVSGQIDNWNHLYLSIFPVGHSVILL